jgi:CHASE3 domain sensor protein
MLARLPTIRFGSLLLAVLLLAATCAIGIATVERLKDSRETVLHTYHVHGLLKDLRSEIDEVHANYDLYLLSQNPDEKSQLAEQSQEELLILADLRKLTVDNPTQQARLDQLGPLLQEDIARL